MNRMPMYSTLPLKKVLVIQTANEHNDESFTNVLDTRKTAKVHTKEPFNMQLTKNRLQMHSSTHLEQTHLTSDELQAVSWARQTLATLPEL